MAAPLRMTLRLGIFHLHRDPGAFSGIPSAITATLESMEDVEVVRLAPPPPYRPSLLNRVGKRISRTLSGRTYLWEKEPRRCRYISEAIDRAAAQHSPDAILIFGSEGAAYIRTTLPVFCYADSVFGTRVDLYPDQMLDGINPSSVEEGQDVQRRALAKLRTVFLSSRWAWERAVERFHYDSPPQKIEVVGIGANLPETPSPLPFQPGPLSFAWVGSYWKRKGGDFAVETIREMRRRGVETKLEIVGDVPPGTGEPWIVNHGRLDYSEARDFARLGEIYARSAALLLPSQAETTPLAIAEAGAFGRATVATPAGAIPEMITDGVNGILLPAGEPDRWADRIMSALDHHEFERLGAAACAAYETRFNWNTVCRKIVGSIRRTISVR